MRRNYRAGVSVFALAAGVSLVTTASGWAQEADQASAAGETIVLEQVTVTGSRIPQQIAETARTIYVVDEKEIQSRARSGESLQQILGQTIPSFDAASQGSRTSYGQNLRGRTALILIDGISMNSARGLSRQFDSIDPFNVARIEVLSGATAIYGGNATGGIINIITKKGRDAAPGMHVEVTAGAESGFQSGDDVDGSAATAVTYNNENFDMRLALAGNKTGAFYDGSGTILVPDITQTSTAFNERVDFTGSAGYQFDADRRLEVSGQFFNSKQESDYGLYFGPFLSALRDPSLFETREGYKSDFNPQTKRSMFNATYSDLDFFGQELLVQAFYRNENINFHPFPSATYFYGSSQETDYFGLKAAMVSEPTDKLKLTYGIDADRDSFSSSQNIFDMGLAAQSGGLNFETVGNTGLYPEIDVSTVAGFLEASYEATDRLTLNGGVRYQFVDTKVSDYIGTAQQVAILQGIANSADAIPGGSVSYDAALLNAGAIYKITDTQQVYANFSQGFELPDPAKYYGLGTYSLSGGHFSLVNSVNVGASALEAIKTNSFEVGYRLDDGTYNFETAAYYSISDKSIILDRTNLSVDVLNQDRRVYGIEGKTGVKLSHGFDAGVSAHWVKSEVKGEDGWAKETIGTASVSKLGGYVGWQGEALSLRFQGQHVFELSDAADYKIEPYTLFDLTGAYRFEAADATLNFGIHNVFDKDYTTIWGSRAKALYGALADESIFDYKGRGRTFALSFTKVF